MNDDDDMIGLLLNLIIGGVVLAIEIGVGLFMMICAALIGIFELFFGED